MMRSSSCEAGHVSNGNGNDNGNGNGNGNGNCARRRTRRSLPKQAAYLCPRPFADVRIQVVVPPLSTLFRRRQLFVRALLLGGHPSFRRYCTCFPILPGKWSAMIGRGCIAHARERTNLMTISSSSFVHGPLVRSGLSTCGHRRACEHAKLKVPHSNRRGFAKSAPPTFCQRCRHCTSERPSIMFAISFQVLPGFFVTASRSASSSSLVDGR
eukprot:scaffold340_cov256-Pinguiococcus_pyrenoidosus.AAC.10